MNSKLVDPVFTAQERDSFRIDDTNPRKRASAEESRFPKTDSMLRKFIYEHTGTLAQQLTLRDCYCFNYSLNQGLDMGLPTPKTGQGDRTLVMLSMMDHALQDVSRFVGVSNLHILRADSTMGHSKQTMRILQNVFEKGGALKTLSPTEKQKLNSYRREALLGAWIHDMGEVVFELTTAGDMMKISPAERVEIKHEKDKVETKIFEYFCQFAAQCIDKGTPELFIERVDAVRNAALEASAKPGASRKEQIVARMEALSGAIEKERERYNVAKDPTEETKKLLRIYYQTEGMELPGAPPEELHKAAFLNALVKTLESVEGLRYLQRNSYESRRDALARKLNSEYAPPLFASRKLTADYEIIVGAQRCETRLPELFKAARTDAERNLARAAASFTYRSIARQFLPEPYDHVGITANIIDRAATQPSPGEATLKAAELVAFRSGEMHEKKGKLEKQNSEGGNPSAPRYITREDIGRIYRAAEDAVVSGDFEPTTRSLISLGDTPTLPTQLLDKAKQMERKTNNIHRLFEPKDSKNGQSR